MNRLATVLAVLIVLSAAGCSSDDAAPAALDGIVQSGGTEMTAPLAGAEVRLWETTDGEPTLLGTATSDGDGNFSIPSGGLNPSGVLYVTASIGESVKLAAVLGTGLLDFATINELTTVATAFAFAQFLDEASIRGGALGLRIAAGMSANLATTANGESSPVLLASPNADQTNSLRSTRNLANLIAGCIENAVHCAELFARTTPAGGTVPRDTLQAMVNLARQPAVNVAPLFSQSELVQPYQPSLEEMPDAWTLAVKVNQTGSDVHIFAGTANTVFDDRGYAWINNNTIQGTSVSGRFIVVLKPDGSPADGADGTPKSPILGGGILGPGYGITRSSQDGSIWIGNFGWGGVNPGPDGNGDGCVSHLSGDGSPISPLRGIDGGTDRVQGIVADRQGNVWTANFGSDRLVVFRGGDPSRAVSAPLPCHPFGVAIAADGTAWVTTIGGGLPPESDTCDTNATVSHWSLEGDELAMLSLTEVGSQLKGVDIDLEGFIWVGSGGDDTVYRLNPQGDVVGAFQGGGIDAPWSVRFDDAGNAWVANFGEMTVVPPNNVYLDAALSVLAGPNSPSGLPVGTPISPPTGYTLPSAGAPVLLSNGTPLSETGNGMQPGFTPLMRAVSAVPDRAGNVWVSNNWKPNFTADVEGDPGGDGMVIYVGLAAPTEPGRTQ